MRRILRSSLSAGLVFLVVAPLAAVAQQAQDDDPPVTLRERKLSGPRLGMTYVVQGSAFARKLEDRNIDNFISQFGWHFEWLVTPQGGGPSFVTELMPFIGGVEYGTVIPSLSLVMGIRMPFGFEFGMGPNVLFTLDRHDPVNTTLVVGLGQSLKFGGVQIPLNLALSTNRDGQRISAMFGYAISNRRKPAQVASIQ
jgi:hypothetical protein